MTTHASGSDGAAAELDDTIRRLADLRERARGGLWCGGVGVGGGIPASSNLLDHAPAVCFRSRSLCSRCSRRSPGWCADGAPVRRRCPRTARPCRARCRPTARPPPRARCRRNRGRRTAGRARSGHWLSCRPDHRSARPALTPRPDAPRVRPSGRVVLLLRRAEAAPARDALCERGGDRQQHDQARRHQELRATWGDRWIRPAPSRRTCRG